MKLTSTMKKAAIKESLLMESDGMDRAQLILAAKAVIDELQDMAEKVAKMEAEGIMPLLDGIRTAFGPEFAERLSDDAAQSLRHAMDALKVCKENIGKNIDNMEQIVTGEGAGNDMAMGTGLGDDETPDANADVEDDLQQPSDTPSDENMGDVGATGGDSTEQDDGTSDEDLEDMFGGDAPTGRDTKESAVNKNVNMLRESADPDRLLMSYVMAFMKKGMTGKQAVMETAKRFAVDASDVVDVVKVYTKK